MWKNVHYFFRLEDFIFIEIFSFYIILHTLNLSEAGPLGIVIFKSEKCTCFLNPKNLH